MPKAYHTDTTVHRMMKAGKSLVEIIDALAMDKKALLDKVLELDSICPKRIKTSEGKEFIWQCPDHLIPVTK